jgi:hypothetical protein
MVDERPIGSSFETFLEEEGILEEIDEAAVKEVIAWQVAEAMKLRGLSKSAMAAAMDTSRAQVSRLLDPRNTGLALHTLFRAAAVLGKRLKVELVDARTNKRRRSPRAASSVGSLRRSQGMQEQRRRTN